MLTRLKEILIGAPLPTQNLNEKRLNKIRALAAFAPDALSSIGYANQEIYLGLVVAGSTGLMLSLPIGLAISGLLVMVALSYFQTIQGYSSGGGSYVVARENLGSTAGLVAASALMIGYLLNAAVSLTAGVEAIASAIPQLWPYRVAISLFLLVVITLANLRGSRESGTLIAIPVYLFLFTYLPLLAYGLIRVLTGGAIPTATAGLAVTQPVTLYLVLRTFATGCTAMTGIEAISNGVPAFEPPEAKNAGQTLVVMAILMGTLFVGSTGLTQYLGVTAGHQQTILSALAHRLLGDGVGYFVIQISTTLILTVAANTSYAGFPRLAQILARDGFLPRQLSNLGDRLVYANGILALAVATGVLIILFNAQTHALIPLFAVGVFLAFTLSQSGMVVHWWHRRGPNWIFKMASNGVGAIATLITVLIIGYSEFLAGAWITIVLIPILIFTFYQIREHYQAVGQELSLKGLPPTLKAPVSLRVVIPISGVHRGIVGAASFAQSISKNITGVYVEMEPGRGEAVRKEWAAWWPDIPLEIVPSPYRSIIGPLLAFLDRTDQEHNDGQLAVVVLPEFLPAKWWQGLLHNQTALLLKAAMLYRRRSRGFQRVVINIPYRLQ